MTTASHTPDGALSFERAIALFLDDMRAFGRLTTDRSAAEYRRTVRTHAEDAEATPPAQTTREHVKVTLRRWPSQHPAAHALDARLLLRLDGRGGDAARQPGPPGSRAARA